jgi:hypothetical protein
MWWRCFVTKQLYQRLPKSLKKCTKLYHEIEIRKLIA